MLTRRNVAVAGLGLWTALMGGTASAQTVLRSADIHPDGYPTVEAVKYFGSLRKLRAASVEEIAQVPGIGDRTALAIKAAVDQGNRKTVSVNTATGEIVEG